MPELNTSRTSSVLGTEIHDVGLTNLSASRFERIQQSHRDQTAITA